MPCAPPRKNLSEASRTFRALRPLRGPTPPFPPSSTPPRGSASPSRSGGQSAGGPRKLGRSQPAKDIRTLVEAEDIKPPEIAGFKSPNETPEPEMQPFKIYEDDRVRVSATLVYHAPIWPAFGYRFDTDEGAVVFSGDTTPSQNLVKLAKSADILVHEVIVSPWIDRLLPPPRNPAQEALRTHLVSAHTQVEKVGKLAEAAGVSTLVLHHIVPGNARAEELVPAQQDFGGQLVIGEVPIAIGGKAVAALRIFDRRRRSVRFGVESDPFREIPREPRCCPRYGEIPARREDSRKFGCPLANCGSFGKLAGGSGDWGPGCVPSGMWCLRLVPPNRSPVGRCTTRSLQPPAATFRKSLSSPTCWRSRPVELLRLRLGAGSGD